MASPTIDTTLGALQAHFDATDVVRRLQGDAIAALGLGPSESPYHVVASGSYWRLRDYGPEHASKSLLIIAAPIKRPYIWDLAPSASAVRVCLEHGLRVRLLEWLPATQDTNGVGLDECALAISACVAQAEREDGGLKPFLGGHSLGGTLAAIYAASASDTIRGLLLLGAPLSFQPEQSGFRDALVSLAPPSLPGANPFPGSLLSHMSALASPGTFIWSRLMDAMLSLADQHALEIHARVERWALDEVALPGKLVQQILDWLYREDRFRRGVLKIDERPIGPASLSAPVLAIVNTVDDVAPMSSLKPFTDAMPSNTVRVIEYSGEIGACLQHLGMLVGREALAKVWPDILAWIDLQSEAPSSERKRSEEVLGVRQPDGVQGEQNVSTA
jgi:polyhydroxyalkanoate synthase subunit PhaC